MKTQMKERGEKFTGEEVRAILAGRKSMFRKVCKDQPEHGICWCPYCDSGWAEQTDDGACCCSTGRRITCPYEPGMRLWVRETWQQIMPYRDGEWCTSTLVGEMPSSRILYAADDMPEEPPKWRPSIHMPRWASRITLEVTDVRCERLWDMDGFDCVAEGADVEVDHAAPKFIALWDAINGKRDGGIYSWDMNPWVWAVSFKRLENSNV